MKQKFKKVSVIGLGYIGLPTAAVLASQGIEVVGVDISQKTIESINRGKPHFFEPDLNAIVRTTVMNGSLRAVSKTEKADAFIIAVPTPFKGNHKPDLSYIEAAVKSIAPVVEEGNLIILESTSPVGTTEKLSKWLPKIGLEFAYCPERVLPGHILQEIVENDRIIGGLSPKSCELASSLYKLFVKGKCLITDARTAEMAKLTENAFRDVNIAFANELSLICDKLNLNVWELIKLVNCHPRVNVLQPGPGVGGHCIGVDPWFIVGAAPRLARLIKISRQVNNAKPDYILKKIEDKLSNIKNPIIACLGLTFKADVDDIRESPALKIATEICKKMIGKVLIVEPYLASLPEQLRFLHVEMAQLDEAIQKADLIVLLVAHQTFKKVDLALLKNKEIVDTRGLWA